MKSIADQIAEQRNQKLGRKIMRTLFMPEIRLSFQTTGMTHRAFLSVIAMMFIQSGLLPYNHPARSMATIDDYGLRDIVGEAWFNLRTRKVMDVQQYGLFFSIFLLFAMAIMIGLMLFAKLVTGTAQAAMTSGLFTSPDPDNDLGLWMINELIGEDMASGGALGNLFSVYSYGVLVIASFIVAWSILSIVVDTAHTGKFFGGRHNPVWWPIRLVFALGILIPLGSGFNAGQYMVVQIAKWGSNFASSAWTAYLSADALGDNLLIVPPKVELRVDDVMRLSNIAACAQANNNYLTDVYGSGASGNPDWIFLDSPKEIPQSEGGRRVFSWSNSKGACGTLTLMTPQASASAEGSPSSGDILEVDFPEGFSDDIYHEYADVYLNVLMPVAVELGESAANYVHPSSAYYGSYSTSMYLNMHTAVITAQNQLQAVLDGITEEANESFKEAALTKLSEQGWASAPLMYHYIAGGNHKMQQEASTKAEVDSQTTFEEGDLGDTVKVAQEALDNQAAEEAAETPKGVLEKVGSAIWGGIKWGWRHSPVGMVVEAGTDLLGGVTKIYETLTGFAKKAKELASSMAGGINGIFSAIFQPFFELFNLYPDVDELHPLAAMSALGAKIINGWAVLLAASAGVAFLAAAVPAVTFGSVLSNIWVVFAFLLSPAILAAVILHVVIPMLPFIRFVFAVSGWLIAIVEGIVMVPVIAIGHLRTDGEGLIGPMLQSTYIMFLQLLLRPILILIGLVVSINLVDITTQYVNGLFFPMIQTLPHGDFDFLAVLIRKISLIALYSAFMYALINSSFKIMDLFPEAVVKYLGSGAQGGMQDREGDNISGAVVAGSVIARGMPQGFKSLKKKDGGANADDPADNPDKNNATDTPDKDK